MQKETPLQQSTKTVEFVRCIEKLKKHKRFPRATL